MKPPLPPIICPHGWRKFDQAQQNLLRFFRGRRRRKGYRRTLKWARAMQKWIDRIYRDNDQDSKRYWIKFNDNE